MHPPHKIRAIVPLSNNTMNIKHYKEWISEALWQPWNVIDIIIDIAHCLNSLLLFGCCYSSSNQDYHLLWHCLLCEMDNLDWQYCGCDVIYSIVVSTDCCIILSAHAKNINILSLWLESSPAPLEQQLSMLTSKVRFPQLFCFRH